MFYFKSLLTTILLGCSLFFISSCSSQSKQKHLVRGEEFLQKHKFQEAVMEFRAAADIDNNSADAHWGLARCYENLGQYFETLDELRIAVKLNPDNLQAQVKLGNYYLLSTPPQIDEAAKVLDNIFARDPNFIEGYILKAGIFEAQGKSEQEILGVLNQAIALDPKRTETYISLSRYYMKRGKTDEAEKAIQKGIEANPEKASGYIEYGRFFNYTERPAEAEAQFSKAMTVEPKNVEAYQAIAEFYVEKRQFEKAETVYKQIVQIQENSPESRLDLAKFYTNIERSNDAAKVYSDIIAEFPEYARARYRLSELYLDQKDNENALVQVEELLKLNDNDAEALMLRARVKMQENKPDEAIRDLEEILKKQPSQKNALFYITQAQIALGQIDQARAFIGDLDKYHPNFLKTKLLKIQVNFTSGEPENALRESNELLERVKDSYPDAETGERDLKELNARALTARGLAYLELGKNAEARTDLQQILNDSPNSSPAMVNLAKVAAADNNSAEAINLYERALAADGKNFDALNGLVGVLTAQKQFDKANTTIDKAISENNNQKNVLAALHFLKSDVFTAKKDLHSAENELKAAIELDENYLPAYSTYAALLAGQNRTAESVEQFKKVIEKKPSASVYTLLGMLFESSGNTAEAEKNYRRSLEIAPQNSIAANNLAWLIANNQGNLDEALRLAQTAVQKNQNVAGYFDTLGWIYYKKELYSPAVEQLKKAVALDEIAANSANGKVDPAYRLRLGMALISAGDKSSARKELEISLLNPQNLSERDMRDAKNLLGSL